MIALISAVHIRMIALIKNIQADFQKNIRS